MYTDHLVEIFREVRRVLRDDGTVWLVIGDGYAGSWSGNSMRPEGGKQRPGRPGFQPLDERVPARGGNIPLGLKPKDLVGIPWRVAFALQADGWYLRSDIIWAKPNPMPECLDPKTRVFIRRNNWVSRVTLAQIARLSELPEILSENGWVRIRRLWKTRKPAIYLLASKVEKLICSPGHRFPISSDRRRKRVRLEKAKDIRHEGYADYLLYCPIGRFLRSSVHYWMGRDLDYDLGFLIGAYVAEGGHDGVRGFRIKLTLGLYETALLGQIRSLAEQLDLKLSEKPDTRTHSYRIRITAEWFTRTVDAFVSGKVHTKALNIELILNTPKIFRQGILDGYIAGDGSTRKGGGWIAASASRRLRDDMSTLASSLGIITSKGQSRQVDKRTGAVNHSHSLWTPYITRRKTKSGMEGVYQVPPRQRRMLDGEREMIDLEVDGGTFLIGDGLITHNSVRDRPTKAHEYVFLLAKSKKYFYDRYAILEPFKTDKKENYPARAKVTGRGGQESSSQHPSGSQQDKTGGYPPAGKGRNKRTVWTVATKPFPKAHFAVFPPDLIEPCILAGTSEKGQCPECGEPWERIVERKSMKVRPGPSRDEALEAGSGSGRTDVRGTMLSLPSSQHVAWRPTCECGREDVVPQIVLDPFIGAGTTALVSHRLGRRCIGIDIKDEYLVMTLERLVEEMEKEEQL